MHSGGESFVDGCIANVSFHSVACVSTLHRVKHYANLIFFLMAQCFVYSA